VRIAIFKDDLEDSRDSFMRDAAPVAVRIEKIEGQNVAVFQYQSEQDLWTMLIAFPQKGVVLVATNEGFPRDVLARMRGAQGERAFPDNLPEWNHVNKQAQF